MRVYTGSMRVYTGSMRGLHGVCEGLHGVCEGLHWVYEGLHWVYSESTGEHWVSSPPQVLSPLDPQPPLLLTTDQTLDSHSPQHIQPKVSLCFKALE